MTTAKLEELLAAGEGFTVEYKECINGLNDSVFETVCSFSNRYGGHILLGVKEINGKGTVIGVNPAVIQDMRKNFVNMLNNTDKINPALYLNLEELDHDGKKVLWVYVPVSSQVEFCGKEIYDRNEDADQKITKNTDLVANLYHRKSNTYFERKIFPYLTAEHLVSNILVHREYGSAFPAKIIIEKDRVCTENWNKAIRYGRIQPENFTPYPKNPLLARFFMNIGRADTLGSGVRNLYKYTKIYSGGEPDLEEGDVFKVTIPLMTEEDGTFHQYHLTERQDSILDMIKSDLKIQVENIAERLGVSRATVLREVQEIKKQIAPNGDFHFPCHIPGQRICR